MRVTPDGATVVCVREVHGEGDEPENQIVALPLDGSAEPRVLAAGRDFYSFPRPSPDGAAIAWTCWDHPNMPWDGTELWVAPLDGPGRRAAGRRRSGGVDLPARVGRRRGACTSSPTATAGGTSTGLDGEEVVQLTREQADLAHPQWLFGGATYAFLEGGAIACVRTERASERLGLLEPGAERVRDLGLPFTAFGFPALSARGSRVAFTAAGARARAGGAASTTPPAAEPGDGARGERGAARPRLRLDPAADRVRDRRGRGRRTPSSTRPPTPGSRPRRRSAAADRAEPRRPDLARDRRRSPRNSPTGRAAASASSTSTTAAPAATAAPTAKGCAAPGASSTAKTASRAATHLAAAGEADGERLTIRGGSAGGYATLCVLVFHDEFAAGASYYGVADLEALARDTHKFEARYLDSLVGPYPERADLYRERSPIHFVERLRVPVILFQGLEDEIVPPNQAETMAAALRANGVPYAYLAFEGEQHGFRRAETTIRCLEAELYFYGRILGFEPAGELEPVEIVGL